MLEIYKVKGANVDELFINLKAKLEEILDIGTDVLSIGVTGGSKYLRGNSDGLELFAGFCPNINDYIYFNSAVLPVCIYIDKEANFLLIQTLGTVSGYNETSNLSTTLLIGGGSLIYKYDDNNTLYLPYQAGNSSPASQYTNLTLFPYYCVSTYSAFNIPMSTYSNIVQLQNGVVYDFEQEEYSLEEFRIGLKAIPRMYISNSGRLPLGKVLISENNERYICIGTGIFYKED